MILLCDTRQQEGKHKNIEQYCNRMGIEMVKQKLSVGDYMVGEVDKNGDIVPGGKISIDTKESCLELAKNIMSSDHRRFRAECQLAKDLGIQLIVLIEEFPPYGKIDLWEVPKWKNSNQFHRQGDPMTFIDPRTLRKAMLTMMKKYGVEFRFCTRRQSPHRVIKYLKGEYK